MFTRFLFITFLKYLPYGKKEYISYYKKSYYRIFWINYISDINLPLCTCIHNAFNGNPMRTTDNERRRSYIKT